MVITNYEFVSFQLMLGLFYKLERILISLLTLIGTFINIFKFQIAILIVMKKKVSMAKLKSV